MDAVLAPKFELRHLRYVIATAEFGGIRRAARGLDVQPSTISRHIRDRILSLEYPPGSFIDKAAICALSCVKVRGEIRPSWIMPATQRRPSRQASVA